MSIVTEAEQAAETAVPALRGARWAIYAIMALIALCALLAAFWWLFIRPLNDHQQAVQSKVDATLGNATGAIATQAIPQINDATRQRVQIDVAVQKGMIDVRQAPDASVSARGVSDATLRAVCVLDAPLDAQHAEQPVHQDPACERVAGPDAGSGQGPD